MFLSIGEAARRLGVTVATIRRWQKSGRLSEAFRTVGNHRRFALEEVARLARENRIDQEGEGVTLCYARVSCHDQKDDLERQANRLAAWCADRGMKQVEIIRDLGSGLNYGKKGLSRVLDLVCRGAVARLVLENKDRLLRFGAELIFRICRIFGVDVIVVEADGNARFEDRLVQDVIELMTVFSARLYGARSHKRRLSRNAVQA